MPVQLERPSVYRTHRIRETERAILGAEGPVLEIGAGDFSFAYLGRDSARYEQWTTVDVAPPCDVVVDMDTDHVVLPFQEGRFGLVICTEVLEHLRWPHVLLSELHRVLRRDGTLVASVPNAVSVSYRLSWLLGRIPSCAASGNLPSEFGGVVYADQTGRILRGGHVIDFNVARANALLTRQGFSVTQLRGSGIIWYRQLLPSWLVPVQLASNIICVARRL